MAAALLHEPEILFLDEPTSGADPLARREFWRRITALAEQGVTVIVTTHFMEEAEYCDRIAILDAGRMLAQGTPAERPQPGTARRRIEPTMEDAFIAIVEQAREHSTAGRAHDVRRRPSCSRHHDGTPAAGVARAGAQGEPTRSFRDPSSIAIGIVMPVLLILLFGYGAVARREERAGRGRAGGSLADRDGARGGLRALAVFRDARRRRRCRGAQELMLAAKGRRHRPHPVRFRPPAEQRQWPKCRSSSTAPTPTAPASSRAMPRAPSANGAARRAAEGHAGRRRRSVVVQSRLWFNEANDSHYFLVPGLIVLIMTLIGAFLTALVMAREWERGTLGGAVRHAGALRRNLLLGKIIPYFVLGMIGLGAVHPRRQIPVPRAVPRLGAGPDRRLDALSAGGARRSACRSPRSPRASSSPAWRRCSSPSCRR